MMHLSLNELPFLCERMVHDLPEGGIIILQGDLASGKTTLTQAFARYLGNDEAVTSSTFLLQQQYGEKLYHYDLYNYGFEKFLSLGMMEELERSGYHLIEWGDEALMTLLQRCGMAYLRVIITKGEDQSRYYEVTNG